MKIKKDTIVVLISAIVITGLFHHQSIGLNLLIFELLFFAWIIYSKQFSFKGLYPVTIGLGFVVTSLFTVITHSVFSYVIHFLVLTLFVGILLYPGARSIITTFKLGLSNTVKAQGIFLKRIAGSKVKHQRIEHYLWGARIYLIPVVVIIVFTVIYRISNPVFDDLVSNAGLFFQDQWNFLFSDFDLMILLTFLVGIVISSFLLLRSAINKRTIREDEASEDLYRIRKKRYKKIQFNSLSNEYRSGVFLLIILNFILLVLNVVDIKWVWFGFEWEGQYLKQFVHSGTYLLILSIIISVVLVLYYFRGNLNFYKENKLLKYLSFIWIAQNALLTISVGIRNFWYIKYYALAYKRIGVIIFLLLTIYGLYTVFNKVKNKKSSFYLYKSNAFSVLVVLMISSCFNWDNIIAKYNFRNADESFLHLNYLSRLSDNSLPYLDKTMEELNELQKIQQEKFPFYNKYMSSVDYNIEIRRRKKVFRKRWEGKNFLSWNYAEYRSYSNLKVREEFDE